MKFGTINGNAARSRALALFLPVDSVDLFLSDLRAFRLMNFRHAVIYTGPNPGHVFPNSDRDDCFDWNLDYWSGRGIDIAADIQHSTGSNQNEPV